MLRLTTRTLGAALLVVVACSLPTDMCACPPTRSAVVVVGSVTDAAGVPLAGARLHFDGVPPTLSFDLPMLLNVAAIANADGTFRAVAYSATGDAEQALRAAIIPTGSADTVRIRTGVVATFRPEHGRLDTVRVALRVP